MYENLVYLIFKHYSPRFTPLILSQRSSDFTGFVHSWINIRWKLRTSQVLSRPSLHLATQLPLVHSCSQMFYFLRILPHSLPLGALDVHCMSLSVSIVPGFCVSVSPNFPKDLLIFLCLMSEFSKTQLFEINLQSPQR